MKKFKCPYCGVDHKEGEFQLNALYGLSVEFDEKTGEVSGGDIDAVLELPFNILPYYCLSCDGEFSKFVIEEGGNE